MKVKMRTYAPYVAALLVPVAAGLSARSWVQAVPSRSSRAAGSIRIVLYILAGICIWAQR